VAEPRGKRVVLVLEPGKLGFQVTYSLLETAHLRDNARVRTTDVAE
jgi:flagella basal body P-ring formation protein FlgA